MNLQTNKPNRISVDGSTNKVSAWNRGCCRRRAIATRGRRSWRQTETTLEGTFHAGKCPLDSEVRNIPPERRLSPLNNGHSNGGVRVSGIDVRLQGVSRSYFRLCKTSQVDPTRTFSFSRSVIPDYCWGQRFTVGSSVLRKAISFWR